MKQRRFFFGIVLVLLLCTSAFAGDLPDRLVAVGQAVGIDVKCGGLLVVGFSEDSPARESGLRQGDRILEVDGRTVEEPEQLRAMLQEKSQVTLTTARGGREQSLLVPLGESGGVKVLGANVKTEMAGIGTVTYYDPATEVFGALGHGITDSGGELFPVRGGFVCRAAVVGRDRGRSGAPGMLQGAFDSGAVVGRITANTSAGIFGQMCQAPAGDPVAVADPSEIHTGEAEILCNVEGTRVDRFRVEIRKIYPFDDGTGRNMLLRVTDPALLQKTGGIVQGMSGSPILQDGKLVGAVTHVLVSDPEVGYGIFIESMLRMADKAA